MEAKLRQWTLEEKLAIFHDWENKLSFVEIASKYGCTVNTIAGMVFRMRKKMGVVPRRSPGNTKPRRPTRAEPQGMDPVSLNIVNRIQELKAAPRIRLRLVEELDDWQDYVVSFEELEKHHCRWPIEVGEELKYCGKPPVGELPYCTRHCALAYVPPRERRH